MGKYFVSESEARELVEGRNGQAFEAYVSAGRLHRLRVMGPRPGIYASECLFDRRELEDLLGWIERRARRRAER